MRARLPFFALAALACSCHGATPEGADASYTLTLSGPTAPFAKPVTITATPTPADDTASVRFSVDDVPGAVDTEAPFTLTLDLTKQWGGPHRVSAVATRGDGTTATASLDVTYDPLGPFVTVLSPSMGQRVPPEGGLVDVSFLASDPSGLAAGAVQIDGGPVVPIPLPALSVSIPVPAAAALPATPTLSWWFDDPLGNRTQGAVPLLQSHQRFAAPYDDQGTAFSLPDGRVVVVLSDHVRSYAADGTVAWSKTPSVDDTLQLFAYPAQNGDIVVVTVSLTQDHIVQRIRADGAVAWTWPAASDVSLATATYLAETDTALAVQWPVMGQTEYTILGIDAGGHATTLQTVPGDVPPALLASPAGASPAGFAVVTDVSPMLHHDVFDPAGAPAWSGDLLEGPQWMLTRDAIEGHLPTMTPWEDAILGPAGTIAHLGYTTSVTIAPNGDVVTSGFLSGGALAVTRVHPDGSTAWQRSTASLDGLYAGAASTAVVTGTTVLLIDAAGAESLTWTPPPDDPAKVSGVRVSPSGAFWVVTEPSGSSRRVLRVAADGTLLWHETVPEGGDTLLPPQAPNDERLLVAFGNPPSRLHVFEP